MPPSARSAALRAELERHRRMLAEVWLQEHFDIAEATRLQGIMYQMVRLITEEENRDA